MSLGQNARRQDAHRCFVCMSQLSAEAAPRLMASTGNLPTLHLFRRAAIQVLTCGNEGLGDYETLSVVSLNSTLAFVEVLGTAHEMARRRFGQSLQHGAKSSKHLGGPGSR